MPGAGPVCVPSPNPPVCPSVPREDSRIMSDNGHHICHPVLSSSGLDQLETLQGPGVTPRLVLKVARRKKALVIEKRETAHQTCWVARSYYITELSCILTKHILMPLLLFMLQFGHSLHSASIPLAETPLHSLSCDIKDGLRTLAIGKLDTNTCRGLFMLSLHICL